MNNLEREIKKVILDSMISFIVNHPTIRQLLYNNFTDSEKAEFTLVAEGECDFSDKTSKKINQLVSELLKETNPDVFNMLQNLQKELQ